jgi:predicted RNase H-like nuclease
MSENHVVTGVDGCPAGWLCFSVNLRIHQTSVKVYPTFRDVLSDIQNVKHIAIDIPIGLSSSGPRDCDLTARRLLGKPRSSSVFPPPVRSALIGSNYRLASAINRRECGKGLTRQTDAIRKKIKEVDDVVTYEMQSRIHEVHPELCFWAMNKNRPMQNSKRKAEGREERRRLLSRCYPLMRQHLLELERAGARADDLFDAAAAAWTAERIASGIAGRIPENPVVDGKGLRMEMWH